MEGRLRVTKSGTPIGVGEVNAAAAWVLCRCCVRALCLCCCCCWVIMLCKSARLLLATKSGCLLCCCFRLCLFLAGDLIGEIWTGSAADVLVGGRCQLLRIFSEEELVERWSWCVTFLRSTSATSFSRCSSSSISFK